MHKKRGETPLEVLSAWKASRPELANVPMSYAGRLDPMAEGKLLVLIGDECKRQESYTKLDKEYEIEVLLDIKTDTGDVLGFPTYGADRAAYSEKSGKTWPSGPERRFFQSMPLVAALSLEIGSHSRRYPVYSSKTVNGKPLFLYALEGTLDTIAIPEHIETIYKIKQLGSYVLTTAELQTRVVELLSSVPLSDEPSKELGADFRQDEVRARWGELLSSMPDYEFAVIRLRVTCAPGAYMRTLAERIGNSLGTTALALSINRTRIGKYLPLGLWGIWTKQY